MKIFELFDRRKLYSHSNFRRREHALISQNIIFTLSQCSELDISILILIPILITVLKQMYPYCGEKHHTLINRVDKLARLIIAAVKTLIIQQEQSNIRSREKGKGALVNLPSQVRTCVEFSPYFRSIWKSYCYMKKTYRFGNK